MTFFFLQHSPGASYADADDCPGHPGPFHFLEVILVSAKALNIYILQNASTEALSTNVWYLEMGPLGGSQV